jgi:hypothetical protein
MKYSNSSTYVNSAQQVPSKTYTLDQFVQSEPSGQLSYYYLSLLEPDKDHNIEYDIYNVLSDYIQDLKDLSHEIVLSEQEYYTYRFRPKLLADYLYGNGELYFIILWLNDIWSVKDFDFSKIRLLSKSELSNALSSINASEKNFIDSYNQSASAT